MILTEKQRVSLRRAGLSSAYIWQLCHGRIRNPGVLKEEIARKALGMSVERFRSFVDEIRKQRNNAA